MPRALLLSTSDTDLLSARASGADWSLANPTRLSLEQVREMAEAADLVVVRLLGTRRDWEEGFDLLRGLPQPLVVLSGEQLADPELMEVSTVPIGVAHEAHLYLAQGGSDNLGQLHAFLSDTVLLTGVGFEPPKELLAWGVHERSPSMTAAPKQGPVVGILFYRAHEVCGNTAFVDDLCTAIEAKGGTPLPLFCASLRAPDEALLAALHGVDAIITTVLAAGGTTPATASAGEQDEAWDVGALATFDVPILQALCLTRGRDAWAGDDDGLSPIDTARQVAIPEFDGRIITVPFSFKEVDDDGLTVYVTDPERTLRVAGLAVSHGRLSHLPNADKRIGLVLSAYPTKHARIGNAVGLDTPASVVRLLAAMREAGYTVGELPDTGDALFHQLIAAGGQDPDWLTEDKLQGNPLRIKAATYRSWFTTLPQDLQERVEKAWGPAPGDHYVDRSADPDGEIVVAALQADNVVIVVQPPRGFGENPVAIYHDPDLPPSHHYLAAYQWLATGFGADALVHVGKHGNLEWLPGKTLGMSASCGTDAALGDMPLIYPFLVNDPGEGSQAKRRAHATLVDHLVPPMARAETYGDMARLEQLLDEHANVAAMDPAKLPAVRQQIWTLMKAAEMDRDLGLDERPEDEGFDDFLLHVDGWLCEVKDVQIRDGLHVLGQAPVGESRALLVLAILRSRQMWSGKASLPGLRTALGLQDESLASTDRFEELARGLCLDLEEHDWDVARVDALTEDETVAAVLRFACTEVVPRLARTTDEITMVLHALDGGYVPAGPSGSPLRGLVNVLPTGRNFYSVDPQAVPSKLAWETGQAMAESLVERYLSDHGDYPKSVGLSAWGTSAMRTSGDDIAEVLALMGVRPVWDDASRRVTSLEVISRSELGRPRIDVTVRISGFFRDAFPHVVTMLDDAVQLAAAVEEDDNLVRQHVEADGHSMRVFGSKPGAYGAGILPLLEAGNWRDDGDLAEVYAVWGGYAYGRDMDGVPARPQMEAAYKRLSVAAKNIDTVEHDILDSDDYFQYHGGMVAMARALTGKAPEAYIGDSTNPDRVRTRTLVEETSRVFRARVVNPRWVSAMRRHGYKGAFEQAATVDYLFGYDATTGVVTDRMYETVAQTYVLDEVNREFLETSNPWALHGMTAKLLEAVDRGLWAEPSADVLAELKRTYLATEGDLEDR